jgi:UDP-N-acetylglucosamine 2-epimerase (non-hydrolysing)
MVAFEQYSNEVKPDLIMVVGDVNSTLACSIVAKKLNRQVAHVEAGLRSGDRSMPEEINRIVTDSISDIFFVTEPSGVENLLKEGHCQSAIHFVGHVMIDNLYFQLSKLDETASKEFSTNQLKKDLGQYGVVTLHRPSNVDNPKILRNILDALEHISNRLPLIFPVHPRTSASLTKFKIELPKSIHTTRPLPYMEFLNLWKDAKLVLTDSGGLQEETAALGIPCMTLRDSTERPITITDGQNHLVGTDSENIISVASQLMSATPCREKSRPPLWDGLSSMRIIDSLLSLRKPL